MPQKLIALLKELAPCDDCVANTVKWTIEYTMGHPGEIAGVIYEEETNSMVFLEYDPLTYKEKNCIGDWENGLDEFCIGVMLGDDFVVDNLYFVDDIDSEIASEIHEAWERR